MRVCNIALRLLLVVLSTAAVMAQPAVDQGVLLSPKRWALVVGASDYEHLGRLRYATRDARDFADRLIASLGFEDDTVRLLTDDADDPRFTPTAGHLIGELESLLADPRRNRSDLFVFYFCGHGAARDSGDYLLPTDARNETIERVGLPVREVVDRLARAGMGNVLVIVDACRQGGANPFGRELWKLADAARLSVLLGCEPGKQSYEDNFFGHGVFTHFLLDAFVDDSLREPASGALWASRVANTVIERVRAHTATRDEPQSPVAWGDLTRDILISAAPPPGALDLEQFNSAAGALDPAARIGALARYAWSLFQADRFAETIEVLKVAEQLGPLPPELAQTLGASLLMLGRSVEAGRVFRDLRASAPDSLPALAATVCDSSGAVTTVERARAAKRLWDSGASLRLGLLMRMVEADIHGGSASHALEFAKSALPQAPKGSRDEHYLGATIAILEQRYSDAVSLLSRAAEAPGTYPDDRMLARERVFAAMAASGMEPAIAILDACIERWPDDGEFLARRAWFRRQMMTSAVDDAALMRDVRAALSKPLRAEDLLLVVRAASSGAPALADEIRARAAEHPLSWDAQIAAVFARQPKDLRAAVEEVSRLSARPALVYATMARLTFDAMVDRRARLRAERPDGHPDLESASAQLAEAIRSLYERLAPMAKEFGTDADAWALLADLSQRLVQHEAFHRLFEQHLGSLVDAGTLPEALLRVHAESCLNTGRLARFLDGGRSLRRDGMERDARRWLEAAWHATWGDRERAHELIRDADRPLSTSLRDLSIGLRALVTARTGGIEVAKSALAEHEPRNLLGMTFHALALVEVGELPTARLLFERLEQFNPENAFFAFVALSKALDDDPRRLAQLAALHQPGNPLLASASFVPNAALDAFVGAHSMRVEFATGPIDAKEASLTLTVLGTGKVVGTVELAGGDALVLRGTIDAFGNLDAQLRRGTDTFPVLAKWAPAQVHVQFAPLRETGQLLQIWGTGNLPYAWVCRPLP
jgi:tetratricopeptide (TPR) repeat protein